MTPDLLWKIDLIKAIAHQRCRHEEEYRLRLLDRIGFTLKAIVCLLLNFQSPDHWNISDVIHVAYTRGGTSYVPGEPTEYWFEAFIVPVSWREWWWDMYTDGS